MHELVKRLWRETGMTVFMVTHDIGEAFKLGTRVLTFDRVRRDPQAPEAYGATITYDLRATTAIGCRAMATATSAARRPPDRRSPARAPLASPELRQAQQPGLEGDRGRGQLSGTGWRKEQQVGARHGPAGLPRA